MRGWLLVLVVLLVACGSQGGEWGIGTAKFDARGLGIGVDRPPDPRLASIPVLPRLAIDTPDGSGQLVHPDVLLDGDRILLAVTPYPYSNDRLENPCLYTGDGTSFEIVGNAPIVPPPPKDHNDDPDLRRDPNTGEYELLYL